jgi:hypothetical protein
MPLVVLFLSLFAMIGFKISAPVRLARRIIFKTTRGEYRSHKNDDEVECSFHIVTKNASVAMDRFVSR